MRLRHFILFIIFIFGLIGCSGIRPPTEEGVYIPPTLAVSPIPIQPPTPTVTPPTPTPACTNDLRYIEDVTIPDGTVVVPGERLDKRWNVQNSGTCNWNEGYSLQVITGPEMGATPSQALFPARSGGVFDLQIIYTAPDEAGVYRSAWQAFGPDGVAFGDPVFIEIIVQ